MATWAFTNDYLEEQTAADLDGSGVIGDGTPGNGTAPAGLSNASYAAGDDYLVQGSLASSSALSAVKSFSQHLTQLKASLLTPAVPINTPIFPIQLRILTQSAARILATSLAR